MFEISEALWAIIRLIQCRPILNSMRGVIIGPIFYTLLYGPPIEAQEAATHFDGVNYTRKRRKRKKSKRCDSNYIHFIC